MSQKKPTVRIDKSRETARVSLGRLVVKLDSKGARIYRTDRGSVPDLVAVERFPGEQSLVTGIEWAKTELARLGSKMETRQEKLARARKAVQPSELQKDPVAALNAARYLESEGKVIPSWDLEPEGPPGIDEIFGNTKAALSAARGVELVP